MQQSRRECGHVILREAKRHGCTSAQLCCTWIWEHKAMHEHENEHTTVNPVVLLWNARNRVDALPVGADQQSVLLVEVSLQPRPHAVHRFPCSRIVAHLRTAAAERTTRRQSMHAAVCKGSLNSRADALLIGSSMDSSPVQCYPHNVGVAVMHAAAAEKLWAYRYTHAHNHTYTHMHVWKGSPNQEPGKGLCS